jgi:hypothetical protein
MSDMTNAERKYLLGVTTDQEFLRDQLSAAQQRVVELQKERAELLWAAQWLLSGRSRVHYFGNDDDTYNKQLEQQRNNERAEKIIYDAALAGTVTQ